MSKAKKLNEGMIPVLAKLLAQQGRGGDTMLAHITPREAELLNAVTDGGSVNPKTGLPEFYDESQQGTAEGDSGMGGMGGDYGDGGSNGGFGDGMGTEDQQGMVAAGMDPFSPLDRGIASVGSAMGLPPNPRNASPQAMFNVGGFVPGMMARTAGYLSPGLNQQNVMGPPGSQVAQQPGVQMALGGYGDPWWQRG